MKDVRASKHIGLDTPKQVNSFLVWGPIVFEVFKRLYSDQTPAISCNVPTNRPHLQLLNVP